MFIEANWPAPPQIKAFSTLRDGGCSEAPFASFNLGHHVGDKEENVLANRRLLSERLALPQEPIWLNQTHSNTPLLATAENRHQEADSSYTHEAGAVCLIMTADCLPILICQPQGKAIAAIHAGWRGLANGIIQNTINALQVDNGSLMAWLGPAIGPQRFEVGPEVYETFLNKNPENRRAFTVNSPNTFLANLYELARIQLAALGINAIYGGEYCTYSQNQLFFSYRRDQGKTGRMASLIWRENSYK